MTHRARWLRGLLGASGVAVALVACTVTQSLDYLQTGVGEPGGPETGGEGGGDAKPPRNPVVLVPDQTSPGLLAQDSGALYWIASGQVLSVAKAGGAPRKLGNVAASDAHDLAVDNDPNGFVFVAVGADVMRFPKDGTDGGVVFKGLVPELQVDTLTADDTSVFVLQKNADDESRLFRMAKDGGAVSDLADSGLGVMTTSATSVFWLDEDVNLDPSFLEQAKTALPGPPIARYPFGKSTATPEASRGVATDEQSLFWSSVDTIVSRKRDPAAAVVALYRAAENDVFGDVALDGAFVYFIMTDTMAATKGRVARVAKTGGQPEILAINLQQPSSLVVDATSVYVSVENTGATGTIVTLSK